MNKINRVFDFMGPVQFVPNAWNYKYSSVLWDYNFAIWHESIDKFNEIYKQIAIFDCNLNLPENVMNFLSISDLHLDESDNTVSTREIKNTENFFYTIHPYGDVYTSLGRNDNYHQNVSVFDNISERAKKFSHSKNFFIIFDYSTEGDIQSDIFYYIHQACERNNINEENVIVISSSENTFDLYNDDFVKNINPDKKLKAVFYPWSLLSKAKDTRKILFEDAIIHFNELRNKNSLMSLDEAKTKNRPNTALCFNRRMSTHRVVLLSLLINDGYLDKNLISFDTDLLQYEDVILEIINENNIVKNNELKQKCVNGFRQMKKIKKNVIDVDDIQGVWGFAFENKDNYINSYFSIVTETLFYRPGNYISEKTWKPIQHLHPFVIVGRPNTLRYLKGLGFETFSEFWDESYDEIEDDATRMEECYKVITKLINLSSTEWDSMYEKILPILEKNREVLISITEETVSDTYIKNITKLVQEDVQKTYSLL